MQTSLFLLLILIYNNSNAQSYLPQQINDGWAVSTPHNEKMDITPLKQLSKTTRFQFKKIDSILIARHNKLVYEKYFNKAKQHKPHNIASAGKSIMSALIGIAINSENIPNVENSIYDFMPYKNYQHWNNQKKSITLQHLLTMTAGWNCESKPKGIKNPCGPIMLKQKDPLKWILDLPMKNEPGTVFNYNAGAASAVRAILILSTGKPYLDYYDAKLLKPLNIKKTKNMNASMLTSRDMAKIGQLFLDGGRWNNKQIIPNTWVQSSTSIQYQFKTNEVPINSQGYGYFWWVGEFKTKQKNYSYFMAAGNGGQCIFVISELNAVIVTTGHYYNETSPSLKLINQYILPSFLNGKNL